MAHQMVEFVETQCDVAQRAAKNLLAAPEAAYLTEVLAGLSCNHDFALSGSDDEKQLFKFRTPQSFKASLYQVICAMCDAFNASDNSMTKIQMNLINVPTIMKDIMDAVNNPNDAGSKEIIKISVKWLNESADKCKKAAQEALESCLIAQSGVTQLSQRTLFTQQSTKEINNEIKKEIKAENLRRKKKEKASEELTQQLETQKREVERAMIDYIKIMKQSTDSGFLMSVKVLDCAKAFMNLSASAIAASGNIPTGIKKALEESISNLSESPGADVLAVLMNNCRKFKKNVEIAYQVMEKSRESANELRKEKAAADKEYTEMVIKLSGLKFEEISFEEILKYLNLGLSKLDQVKHAWDQIGHFFESIHNMVNISLIDNAVKIFTTYAQNDIVSKQIQSIMYRNATQACIVAVVVMKSAGLYKVISDKHVMPHIKRATKNLCMNRQETVMENFEIMQSNVQKTIESHHELLSTNIMKALEMHGYNSKAIQLAIEPPKTITPSASSKYCYFF